jgi:hypothetical protein
MTIKPAPKVSQKIVNLIVLAVGNMCGQKISIIISTVKAMLAL